MRKFYFPILPILEPPGNRHPYINKQQRTILTALGNMKTTLQWFSG